MLRWNCALATMLAAGLLSGPALAGIVGPFLQIVDATSPDTPAGHVTIHLYVAFTEPTDALRRIEGADLRTVSGTLFYQHALGDDRPPLPEVLKVGFKNLAADSFVTLDVLSAPEGEWVLLDVDWQSAAFNRAGIALGGWLDDDEATPVIAEDDLRVRIAQLTINIGAAEPSSIDLNCLVQGGLAAVPARGQPVLLTIDDRTCPNCTGDVNSSGEVDPGDLALLLGAWTTGNVDLNGDGQTNPTDLALMLGNWGPCGVS